MSIPKNVRLYLKTTKVDPMLLLAVNKLTSFNSAFQFEGISAINDDYTNGFTIFDGVDKVGTIEFGNHHTKADSNGNCAPAFAVGSPKVQKARGNRSKVITGDLGAAVRHAKKLLAKPDIEPQAEDIAKSVFARLGSVTSDIDYKIRHTLTLDHGKFAYWLAENLDYDGDGTTGQVSGHEKLKLSDIPKTWFSVDSMLFVYKQRFENTIKIYRNAYDALVDGNGAFVKRLRGDGVRVFEFAERKSDEKAPEGMATMTVYLGYTVPSGTKVSNTHNNRAYCSVCMTDYPSIDAAPNWVKEKISTLTLAECDHAIPNIGIKVQSDKTVDLFFIYRKQFLEDEANENTATV